MRRFNLSTILAHRPGTPTCMFCIRLSAKKTILEAQMYLFPVSKSYHEDPVQCAPKDLSRLLMC